MDIEIAYRLHEGPGASPGTGEQNRCHGGSFQNRRHGNVFGENFMKTSEVHGDVLGAQGYTISCYYELLEMFVPLLLAPFNCEVVNYKGGISQLKSRLKYALPSVATVYNI